jgi:hypothetical protein
MKLTVPIILLIAIFIFGVNSVMAIEEAKYNVLKKDDRFQIRDYAPQVLAEIIVDGSIEQAGNKAFSRLFRYISGENRSRDKIEMTAPVSQDPRGGKIKMTAPVSLQPAEGRWAVSFIMPASYTLETLPVPDDPGIILREVPARRMAVVRYSGFWSEKKYLRYKKTPFTLWFLRRNEILIQVEENNN